MGNSSHIMNSDYDNEFDDPDFKSKTEVKQEMHALRELGVNIAELPLKILDTLELSEVLRAAIEDYRRIGHKNALKRQASFIGKLLRKEDADVIRAQLDAIQEDRHRATRQLHVVEQWRDRLLSEAQAFDDFVTSVPQCDRQQLRSLLRAAEKERQNKKPPASARKLFKLIQLWLNQAET